MTQRLILQDFGESKPLPNPAEYDPAPPPPAAVGISEDERLAAFETGYKSGWEDCAAADADQARRVGADLATNLQDCALTYDQARRDVLVSLTPFFDELVGQILPTLATEALAPVILAELASAAEKLSDPEAVLIAAPAVIPALEALLEGNGHLNIALQPEPAFAEGQVSLRYARERRDINLSDAAARIATAIQDFVHQETQGVSIPDAPRPPAIEAPE